MSDGRPWKICPGCQRVLYEEDECETCDPPMEPAQEDKTKEPEYPKKEPQKQERKGLLG